MADRPQARELCRSSGGRQPVRAGKVADDGEFPEKTGTGGRLQRFDWDGKLLWDFKYASPDLMHHHDFAPLPNGNVLLIAWERIPRDEVLAAGRDPETLQGDSLWSERVVEIKPEGLTGGEIVWQWRLWDHIIQDFDEAKPRYGDPALHPELVDLNYVHLPGSDWIHMNAIDYHPGLDQILLSSRWFDEIWVIDHGTTTAEAAGHSAGRRGHGGDLLYRWGNAAAYQSGSVDERMLYRQHDANWIDEGLEGAGNILLFNNGNLSGLRRYSTVDEFTPPLLADGTYQREPDAPYGPNEFVWRYEDRQRLFSPRISGAQRLPNGNTLVCSGTQRTLVEVTPDREVVWVYIHPRRLEDLQKQELQEQQRREMAENPEIPEEFLPRDQRFLPDDDPDDSGFDEDDGGTLFNAIRYPLDYPAFRGRDLTNRETDAP